MRTVPENLFSAFSERVRLQGLPEGTQRRFFKWLRFYLDFCSKNRHLASDRDSLQPFLQILASRQQSPEQQEQAVASLEIYYGIMEDWAASSDTDTNTSDARWAACLVKLKEEIGLRQYSPKTLQAYRGWILHFQRFLNGNV